MRPRERLPSRKSLHITRVVSVEKNHEVYEVANGLRKCLYGGYYFPGCETCLSQRLD